MGVPRAAPTSWVSRWDTGLVLPPASRSTSVTDGAASGATDALAGPCPGLDPPWGLVEASPPHHSHPRPGWGCLDVSPAPSPPPQTQLGLAGRVPPSIAPSHTQLGFAGCVPTPITPILQPVRACWMCPSITPPPCRCPPPAPRILAAQLLGQGDSLGTSPAPGCGQDSWPRSVPPPCHRHNPDPSTERFPLDWDGDSTSPASQTPGARGVPVPVPHLPTTPLRSPRPRKAPAL